jgi:hypothetical protein
MDGGCAEPGDLIAIVDPAIAVHCPSLRQEAVKIQALPLVRHFGRTRAPTDDLAFE